MASLNYGTSVIEAMKAFTSLKEPGVMGLFRPLYKANMLRYGAMKMCLPDFDANEFVKLLIELIKLNVDVLDKSNP